MSAPRQCQVVGLEEVYEASFELAQRVREAGYAPDLVVAVARGGFVPARLVCDFLCLRDLVSVGVRHYAPGARRESAARVSHPIAAEITGRRLLVVDDVNDSGLTIEAVRALLTGSRAADFRVGVLHEKPGTRARADFRAVEVPDQRWLVYQWAVVEDAVGFLSQMRPPPASADEARKRLAGECGIVLEEAIWSKVAAVWVATAAGGAPGPPDAVG